MPKLMFVSDHCLLDRSSGTAISQKAILETLAGAGWEVRAATLSCCAGDQEYPFASINPTLDPVKAAGMCVSVDDGTFPHEIYIAHSTQLRKLRPWELQDYVEMTAERLKSFRPDIVMTNCSFILRPLLAQAKQLGAKIVYYLGDPLDERQLGRILSTVDKVIAPSNFLASFMQDSPHKPAQVVRPIIPEALAGKINQERLRVSSRKERYVTMFDPSPEKGGLLFFNIVSEVSRHCENIKFRCVEGIWGKRDWERLGISPDDLGRIEWLPFVQDTAVILEETSLLLVPSLVEHECSQVVTGAMLGGVPVLAMRNSALAEQIGDGGIMFDPPPVLVGNHLLPPPTEEIHRWAQFVRALMENDKLYERAVALALKQANQATPEQNRQATLTYLSSILREPLHDDATLKDPRSSDAARHYREAMVAELTGITARLESDPRGGNGLIDDAPYSQLLQRSLAQPAIKDALAAVNASNWDQARSILDPYLRIFPEDIAALAMLAEVAEAQEQEAEVARLLEKIVTLAPGFLQGQERLISFLRRSGNTASALTHSAALLSRAPENPRYQALHAGLLSAANRYHEAIALYEMCCTDGIGSALDWMQYGLALKTVGRRQAGIEAFRKAIEISPENGAAWHGLSNMKLEVFGASDIDYLEYVLAEKSISDIDKANIHFTLGKAYEDAKNYKSSFDHYSRANAVRSTKAAYDPRGIEEYVAQAKDAFSKAFFSNRKDFGLDTSAPIFVLGLHRAGSTLVEQILASHSLVEGTRELPYMLRLGRHFGGINLKGSERGLAIELLNDLTGPESRRIGQRYLDLCKADRVTSAPYFVDKMPTNWVYTGLIHLCLPNARIIDIRRRPMAAGFAQFKMNFGDGVAHSFDQENIARYYCAYSGLMAHFDEVLPGRVHHIQYETLVSDTESEIRRLLKYCRLPFEDSCLRYWETDRAVHTPSSEQVRQPIFKSAVDQWTHYADWLGPMREAFANFIDDAGMPSEHGALKRTEE